MREPPPDLPVPIDLPDGSVQALLVNPHPLTRIGLGIVLHRQPWIERCLPASSRDEGIALATRHRPDVAVVDISDAGPFISSYLEPLRALRPAMPVLLSTQYRAVNQAQVLAAGGVGLITPDLSVEQVVGAVRTALVGGASPVHSGPERSDHHLSEREREVLALLCTGATNYEIATAMHVGIETVKKHAGSVYRKLGVRNRTEAAQRAATVLTPPPAQRLRERSRTPTSAVLPTATQRSTDSQPNDVTVGAAPSIPAIWS
jgi:DNA-binding NarL/FixJ family response regulator